MVVVNNYVGRYTFLDGDKFSIVDNFLYVYNTSGKCVAVFMSYDSAWKED